MTHRKMVASRKGGTKTYMAINMHLHINVCLVIMQTCENKTLHVLEKAAVGEAVYVCVFVFVFVFVLLALNSKD
jgi:hypothetical protein